MVIHLHKGQLDYFRRIARNNTNEIYAVLVGKYISKNNLEIYEFIHAHPEDCEEYSPSSVTCTKEFINYCEDYAKERGLKIVGDIHTHPNWPPILSPTDHKGHVAQGHEVSGVVEVTNGRTRVAFWKHDTSLRCTIKYL